MWFTVLAVCYFVTVFLFGILIIPFRPMRRRSCTLGRGAGRRVAALRVERALCRRRARRRGHRIPSRLTRGAL